MINTIFGQMVATGAAGLALFLFISYLRLRRESRRGAESKSNARARLGIALAR